MTARPAELIKDTVDLHYHSGPSPFPRRLDPVEAAKHYDEHGFKAVVYKSHHHNTVMDVLSIKASEVFGRVAHQLVENGVAERDVRRMLSDNPGSLFNR
ncbi:MAG TPA: DUF6282 family protein [Chloroflexota bacterium]|nr:DUF6282 family protein [Chloroflexota bacterium]